MNTTEQVVVTVTAIRWSTNLLTEVGNNYGGKLSPSSRKAIAEAIRALVYALDTIRREE